jgi:phage/plasmid-like protein (TIGR03299 family)
MSKEATMTESAIPSTMPEKVFEILEQTGLNWTVNQVPLISKSENEKLNGLKTDCTGIFRNDNGEWLGTVSGKYTPYQNFQLAETIVGASEGFGLDVSRGGVLSGGRKVYLQTELKTEFIGKSDVKRFITALNSHNGSSSIGFGSSNTVVVCQNTFYKAYKDINKFRHTASASDRIKLAMTDLRRAIELDEKLMKNFKVMSDTPLRDEVFASILKKCFDADLDSKKGTITPQKVKQLERINQAISTELELEGATLWGLFNGVTRFTNHYSNTKNKVEHVMTGGGYQTNLVAYETIMAWIDENTNKEVEFVG